MPKAARKNITKSKASPRRRVSAKKPSEVLNGAIRRAAKRTWDPWTGDPNDLFSDDVLQRMLVLPCRAAFAYMCIPRDQQIAAIRQGQDDPLFKLASKWKEASEDLQGLIEMLNAATARLLAASCAAVVEEQRKSPGCSNPKP